MPLSLSVDGGDPPAPPDAELEHGDEHGDEALGGAVVALDQPPETEEVSWSLSTIKTLVGIPFMVAHVFASRRGPSDAWQPDNTELLMMAEPLHTVANRYTVLRALARFGDPIAFVTATGAYTAAESRRIEQWRADYTYADPAPPPDADLADLGVTATVPGGRDSSRAAATGGLRTWRPPVIPPEGA